MPSVNDLVLAYTDPGSGALILQMLMAALFGALFYFRSFRDRVLGLFRRGTAKQPDSTPSETEPRDNGDEESS